MTHSVSMLAYPDAQILDITGPLEVFARTARWLSDHDMTSEPAYRVELLAERAGPLRTSSGLELVAQRAYRDAGPIDTLLVTGGLGFRRAGTDPALRAWLVEQAGRVKRLGSICTGSIVLAQAGLLDHHRATTHWAYCAELAKAGDDLAVDADAIYVRDGKLYTSAGVTAGMDLALAMVEEDWGQPVAVAVARELVMYLKRPGGQSQFSGHLKAQALESSRLQQTVLWILDHLDQDLTVAAMAAHAAMSERSFSRRFAEQAGVTPARFVAEARVRAARRKLEQTGLPIETIAARCGFGSSETMRRAFLRELGISPSSYRDRFRSAHPRELGVATER